MTNEQAVIIAALITMIGGVIIYELSTLHDSKVRKADAQERFFYEVFSRRLALYEDIVIWTDSLSKQCAEGVHAKDAVINSLLVFENRCVLYGTDGLKGILFSLRNNFSNAFIALDIARKNAAFNEIDTETQVYAFLLTFITEDLEKLQKYMTNLSYGAYIDRLQVQITGELMEKQKS